MILLFLLIACAFSFGLVNLAPLFGIRTPLGDFNAEDVLLIVLLVISVPSYLRQRVASKSPWTRRVEFAWLLFILLLAIQSFRSPATSLAGRFVNVRFVQGYLLFFPTLAVVTSAKRLRILLVAGVAYALAGTVLTILQSLHGLENLFASQFYDIGAWAGNKMIVGGLARVNLPISDWVAFVILAVLAYGLIRPRPWHVVLIGFLSFTVLLNFARSLWLGMFAGFLVLMVLLGWLKRLRVKSVLGLTLIPLAALLAVGIAPMVGFQGLHQSLLERIGEGTRYFYENAGTWAARLSVGAAALALWRTNPLWRIGTAYYSVFGMWIDLGLPAALVSIGLIGLVIEVYLLLVCSLAAIEAARRGGAARSTAAIVLGIVVPAEIVLILVYQQWVAPSSFAILGVASALALVAPGLLFEGQMNSSKRDREQAFPATRRVSSNA